MTQYCPVITKKSPITTIETNPMIHIHMINLLNEYQTNMDVCGPGLPDQQHHDTKSQQR